MKIGTITEIKNSEYRVGLTPHCAQSYTQHGHQVYVQRGAGIGAGFSDDEYVQAGAQICADAQSVADEAEMIVKVKEPIEDEFHIFHEGQCIFTYLHLAANEALTHFLLEKKINSVAYETIKVGRSLPCLRPMSEIAGRLSVQEGAKYLEKPFGGRGVLLGGVPGVKPGKVTIIGGGISGANALKIAVGMGADVTVLDINTERLAYLDDIYGNKIKTLYSNPYNIEQSALESDLIVGAVLIPGAKAPQLLQKEIISSLRPGTVVVDIAIDQGGCFETSRATTHNDPIYLVDNVVHYCVSNMPGAVTLTSTLALTNATRTFGLQIADLGLDQAIRSNAAIREGVNTYHGLLTQENIAKDLHIEYAALDQAV